MATYSNITTSNMDHVENFVDLDDLDLAGVELTSWEVVAGGATSTCGGGCSGPAPTTTLTCLALPY